MDLFLIWKLPKLWSYFKVELSLVGFLFRAAVSHSVEPKNTLNPGMGGRVPSNVHPAPTGCQALFWGYTSGRNQVPALWEPHSSEKTRTFLNTGPWFSLKIDQRHPERVRDDAIMYELPPSTPAHAGVSHDQGGLPAAALGSDSSFPKGAVL